ncbi:hypothetical protein IWQ55_004035 [Labrenzia sp. EL_208]|nr:hypothetical protein [Labrenzia sp. EL_132]MBG6230812.1 hypothetical protein [Labrenzia sp. EL_208]
MKLFQTLKTAAIAAVMGVAMLGAASAAPISGKISITGDPVTVFDAPVDGVIDRIEFATPGAYSTGSIAVTTGSFAPVASTAATMFDIDLGVAGTKVWEVGAFAFTWTTVLLNSFVDGGEFDLILYGFVTENGSSDTAGYFSLSSQSLSEGIAGDFSSTTTVPLPASILLLGGALVGMGAAARRRKNAAA